MNKDEIVKILQEYKEAHSKKYNIQTMGIFGSVARGEAREGSDIDVVLNILEPDLFMLVGIKNDLEERFHRTVDLVRYRENMNKLLKQKIDAEAVYV